MLTKAPSTLIQELLDAQQAGIQHYFNGVDQQSLQQILLLILNCQGRVVLTGVGKSGFVAQKVAATLVSTGTDAAFLDPMGALHGDLGAVRPGDLVLLFSKSGESEELLSLVPCLHDKGADTMAVTCVTGSRLQALCTFNMHLPLERELCPFNLAPTLSPTVQMLFGDLLVVALMYAKEFDRSQYGRNHPSGRIGKRLLLKVRDLMRKEGDLPLARPDQVLEDVLVELSAKRCGCLLVVGKSLELLGIFTDGDLRRALERQGGAALQEQLGTLMTPAPKWIAPDILAYEAMQLMEEQPDRPVMVLPVVEESRVVGLIKLHDVVQAGL